MGGNWCEIGWERLVNVKLLNTSNSVCGLIYVNNRTHKSNSQNATN